MALPSNQKLPDTSYQFAWHCKSSITAARNEQEMLAATLEIIASGAERRDYGTAYMVASVSLAETRSCRSGRSG